MPIITLTPAERATYEETLRALDDPQAYELAREFRPLLEKALEQGTHLDPRIALDLRERAAALMAGTASARSLRAPYQEERPVAPVHPPASPPPTHTEISREWFDDFEGGIIDPETGAKYVVLQTTDDSLSLIILGKTIPGIPHWLKNELILLILGPSHKDLIVKIYRNLASGKREISISGRQIGQIFSLGHIPLTEKGQPKKEGPIVIDGLSINVIPPSRLLATLSMPAGAQFVWHVVDTRNVDATALHKTPQTEPTPPMRDDPAVPRTATEFTALVRQGGPGVFYVGKKTYLYYENEGEVDVGLALIMLEEGELHWHFLEQDREHDHLIRQIRATRPGNNKPVGVQDVTHWPHLAESMASARAKRAWKVTKGSGPDDFMVLLIPSVSFRSIGIAVPIRKELKGKLVASPHASTEIAAPISFPSREDGKVYVGVVLNGDSLIIVEPENGQQIGKFVLPHRQEGVPKKEELPLDRKS